jgi:hypothetical protein
MGSMNISEIVLSLIPEWLTSSVDEVRDQGDIMANMVNKDIARLPVESDHRCLILAWPQLAKIDELKVAKNPRGIHRGPDSAGVPASCASDRYNQMTSPNLPRLAIFNLGLPTPVPTYTISSTVSRGGAESWQIRDAFC